MNLLLFRSKLDLWKILVNPLFVLRQFSQIDVPRNRLGFLVLGNIKEGFDVGTAVFLQNWF